MEHLGGFHAVRVGGVVRKDGRLFQVLLQGRTELRVCAVVDDGVCALDDVQSAEVCNALLRHDHLYRLAGVVDVTYQRDNRRYLAVLCSGLGDEDGETADENNEAFEDLDVCHVDLCVIDAYPGADISEITQKAEKIADNVIII